MASAQFADCSARWPPRRLTRVPYKTPGRRLAHHRVVAELPNLVFVTLVAVLQVGLCVLTKCARARCVGAPRTEPDLPADSQTKMLPPLPRHSDLLVAAGDQEELRASRAPMNARRLRKLLGFWNGQKTNLGFGQFPPGRLLLPGASLDVGRSARRGCSEP